VLEQGPRFVEQVDLLNEGQHNGLGDHVDHGALDDVEVRSDEQFWI
jgi:hypothetical protein